ncbi:MAG: hypothetical protein U0840_21735 [Gemmataceae bacterium]
MSNDRPSKRTSQNVLQARVREVFKLRLGGAEFLDIVEYGVQNGWRVSDRTIRKYISCADRLCKKVMQRKFDGLLERHLLQRRQLYAHAMNAGQYNVALAILKDEAELAGLYPPKEHRMGQSEDATPVHIVETVVRTREEASALLARLEGSEQVQVSPYRFSPGE